MITALAVLVGALAWCGAPPRLPTAARRVPAGSPGGPVVLSSALLVVAAQLRAGATPEESWRRALGQVVVEDGVPSVEQLVGAPSRRGAGAASRRAAAVVVAAGAARALGAPLAGVLEQVARSVAADEEAAAELHAALAGPRATARVLSWLPVLGMLVAALLGAHPWAVVLGGGLGTAAAVLGVALLLVGRLWTRVLLSRAGWGGRAAGDRRRPAVGGRR